MRTDKASRGRRAGAAAAFVLALFAGAGGLHAQDLVYTPVNPSFGGSPLNSSHLLGIANAQRTATARDADDGDDAAAFPGAPERDDRNDTAELFARQLESRLLSALSRQVTDAIFGDDPQESGTVTFGTTTVSFDRSLSEISLVITDNLDGTVTEIVVPQLVTSN